MDIYLVYAKDAWSLHPRPVKAFQNKEDVETYASVYDATAYVESIEYIEEL